MGEAKKVKRSRLQQPRQCVTCGSGGKCVACSGTGCIEVTYLSQGVGDSSHLFSGRTLSGCRACGGRQDGAEVLKLDVLKGSGRCSPCQGAGATHLSRTEVALAMKHA